MTILVVILVLGLVIFVHELGHFLAAKLVGVQVLRFSIGFGPPLLSWRRGETEYWIASVPLGGYVKMAGLEDEELTGKLEGGAAAVPVDPARTLESKPLGARFLVMVAGVSMNVVLAYVLYAGIRATAFPEPAMLAIDSVATASLPPQARALAALEPGSFVVRINGDTLATWRQFERWVTQGPDTLRIELAGRARPLVVALPRDTAVRRAAWRALTPRLPPIVGLVIPGAPAHRAGLEGGDLVLRVDADTVRSWSELVGIIRRSAGDSLRLVVRRGERRVELTVVPQRNADPRSGLPVDSGFIGAQPNPPVVYVGQPLGRALVEGLLDTVDRTGQVVVFLGRLVTGGVSVREIGGPVLIAQLSGQAAQLGVVTLLGFIAFISLNLAVLNLLPIPVLDGGHVLFLLIEAVRGRPLSVQLRLRLTQLGFVVLIALMVLAISNDVLRNLAR
ncbi:MAG TPA: RIP metalloprotease RseP [Gemmatimonadales bacterium]|nr:RIP metalloprotease RseP [Gemmatimonadales bacterium]